MSARRALAFLLTAFLTTIGSAEAANRVAFVIGNDNYQNIEPLRKAVNDARAISDSIQRLGFRTTVGQNLGWRDFIEKFSTFENSVQPGDIAFLFYSGHGVEIDGANYLVPVDAPKIGPDQQSLLKDVSISTDALIKRLKDRGVSAQILVLDACRENPFRQTNGRSVGGTKGLARISAPGGVFVLYSAGVGEAALDRLSDSDLNPNSVFTRSLLPLLENPQNSLVAVAKNTRAQVKTLAASVGSTQSPAYYDEIDGNFFLASKETQTGEESHVSVASLNLPLMPPPVPEKVAPIAVSPSPMPLPQPKTSDFIFADSDRVRIDPSILRRLSAGQLRIARNEIYARRGRYFKDAALRAHFSRFSWYRPYAWDVSLNATEKANVDTITAMER